MNCYICNTPTQDDIMLCDRCDFEQQLPNTPLNNPFEQQLPNNPFDEQIAFLEHELQNKESEIEYINKTINDVEQEVKKLASKLERKNQIIDDLDNEIEDLEETLYDRDDEIEDLEYDIKMYKNFIDETLDSILTREQKELASKLYKRFFKSE